RTLGATTSVNFVAAHDGMTVADLVTYQRKRNHGNGDNNTDGHEHDINQFIGPDGPTTDPDIVRRRQARARSLLGTLFVARGIPMILGGDEFGRTQQGNNNAYCHDSNLSWIDWSLRERNRGLLEFVEQASRLRADEPALRIDRFPDDSVDEADPWVWFGESGKPLSHEQWNDPERRSFGIVVDSSFGDHRTWLVILFNSGGADIAFNAPVAIAGVGVRHVERVLSSAMTDHDDMVAPAGSIAVYRVTVD
ncbi:MAG: glycogen debranching enzyme GlgX, partial [Chloroflexota bacterium]|nr:glycogen debranching enzyme GlgX [Chloroflexota bacterium]